METILTFPKQTFDSVVAVIESKIAIISIYCFGYNSQNFATSKISSREEKIQRTHFDLLVFFNEVKSDAAVEISNSISDKTNKSVTFTLLLHKLADLNTKNPCMQWFFWSILQRSKSICYHKGTVPYLTFDGIPARDIKSIKNYWLKCEAVALYHIHSAVDTPHLYIELVKIAQLHEATEQIALGLIRIFLGYTPNFFSLKFLLGLCDSFTGIASAIFPTETENQLRRFKQLCAPPSMLRHWVKLNAAEDDFVCLLQNVTEFLEEGSKLAMAEINRLENNSNLKTNAR